MNAEIENLDLRCEEAAAALGRIKAEIGKVIVGQERLLDRLLLALLCDRHVLIEGIPGLAKTLTVTTLAQAFDLSFSRVQFTPDLLPGDLTGTQIFKQSTGEFVPRKGPIFANIVLADEINRSPAKVQSALLEAMQERCVTIGKDSFRLDNPFLVLATQNPIEQDGTYPLPEAQVDRFMFKVLVDYPARDEEKEIQRRMACSKPKLDVSRVAGPEDIVAMRSLLDRIYMDESLEDYILDLVACTRRPDDFGLDLARLIKYGASPRATIFLSMAARAHALLEGRAHVTADDVKAIGMDILRHRVIITYQAEAKGIASEEILSEVFDTVEVP